MFKFSMHLTGIARALALALCALALGGCAVGKKGPDPRDPFERVNRGIYQFNDRLDAAVLQPTAKAYRFIVPTFVRQSVSNVYSNVDDVRVGLNNVFQGKFATAYSDLGRVLINSSIGMFGLFDVASEAGIEKHQEDFGQTLAKWGVREGPYMILPLFGPSTVRDTGGWVVDWFLDPIGYVDPTRARNQLLIGRFISRRTELLDATKVLDAAALDEYEFVRDAYLQRRGNLVYDGQPPADKLPALEPPRPNEPSPTEAPKSK